MPATAPREVTGRGDHSPGTLDACLDGATPAHLTVLPSVVEGDALATLQ